jgi:DNA-binding CsgD family transcriptional regulator
MLTERRGITRSLPSHVREAVASWARRKDVSPAEFAVLSKVAGGLSNKEAASELGIAETTVRSHVLHICRKLRVRSRGQLSSLFAAQVEAAYRARVRTLSARRAKAEAEILRLARDLDLAELILRQLPLAIALSDDGNRLRGWTWLRNGSGAHANLGADSRRFSIRDDAGRVVAVVLLATD